MDFAEYGDLTQVLSSFRGRLDKTNPISQFKSIVSSVMRAVIPAIQHLKKYDLAHLDIKCSNIMLYGDGKLKLSDFGLSSRISEANEYPAFSGFHDSIVYANKGNVYNTYNASFAPELCVNMLGKWVAGTLDLHQSDIWGTANLVFQIKNLLDIGNKGAMYNKDTYLRMIKILEHSKGKEDYDRVEQERLESKNEFHLALYSMCTLFRRDCHAMLKWANGYKPFIWLSHGAGANSLGAEKVSTRDLKTYADVFPAKEPEDAMTEEKFYGLSMKPDDIRITECWGAYMMSDEPLDTYSVYSI
jgi:serine/threonine protein kinase